MTKLIDLWGPGKSLEPEVCAEVARIRGLLPFIFGGDANRFATAQIIRHGILEDPSSVQRITDAIKLRKGKKES